MRPRGHYVTPVQYQAEFEFLELKRGGGALAPSALLCLRHCMLLGSSEHEVPNKHTVYA